MSRYLLIKNIPSRITCTKIDDVFSRYGPCTIIVNGDSYIINYNDHRDCSDAFDNIDRNIFHATKIKCTHDMDDLTVKSILEIYGECKLIPEENDDTYIIEYDSESKDTISIEFMNSNK